MPAELRAIETPEEQAAGLEVVRRAWLDAYSSQFAPAEIERAFAGEAAMEGDWTSRRTASAGTIGAYVHDRLAGIVGLGILEAGVGEVAALYVDPMFQGSGVGRQLWEAAIAVFAHRGIADAEVWTLETAAARGFYERMGCVEIGVSGFRLGNHPAQAVGYRITVAPPPGEHGFVELPVVAI